MESYSKITFDVEVISLHSSPFLMLVPWVAKSSLSSSVAALICIMVRFRKGLRALASTSSPPMLAGTSV